MHVITKLSCAAGLALVALSGCSNNTTGGASAFDVTRQAISQIASGIRKDEDSAQATVADTPDAMAARALAANPAPLILVGLENAGTTQVLAMVGENRDMRSYQTPNAQSLILRGGILTGTRGLGNDLSAAEIDGTSALIRARQAGTARRTMRYYTGDGIERPLPLSCTISTAESKSFAFAGRNWQATQVSEACQGSGAEITNSYLVTADGQIPVSRQWIGPELGYVTIQTIRP